MPSSEQADRDPSAYQDAARGDVFKVDGNTVTVTRKSRTAPWVDVRVVPPVGEAWTKRMPHGIPSSWERQELRFVHTDELAPEVCAHDCGIPMTQSAVMHVAVTHRPVDERPILQAGRSGHIHMHEVALFRSAPPHRQAHLLGAIADERRRQDEKWGEQNHPDGTGPRVLPLDPMAVYLDLDDGTHLEDHDAARLADVARHACKEAAHAGHTTWRAILLEEVFEALAEADPARLRTELVQVAAVATQWAEAIDRREATP